MKRKPKPDMQVSAADAKRLKELQFEQHKEYDFPAYSLTLGTGPDLEVWLICVDGGWIYTVRSMPEDTCDYIVESIQLYREGKQHSKMSLEALLHGPLVSDIATLARGAACLVDDILSNSGIIED